MKNHKTVIISLGGSVIIPAPDRIDVPFLKKFRKMILKFTAKNYKFVIITGGGKLSRVYQNAASEMVNVLNEDIDWLGVHATRINGHLLRVIFRKIAYPVVLDNPYKTVKNNWKVLICAGWKPGFSSDYDAVLMAQRFGAKEIINASNISHVYTKDFKIYKDAEPIERISWKDYQKIIGTKWTPSMSAPFDPIASKLARKLKIRTFIIKGTDVDNFENLLLGKEFIGTVIGP
jgi:uridylate kinase